MDIAVITGASSGIGECFVIDLNKEFKFDEIWLISRRREKLETVSKRINTKTRIIDLDLSNETNLQVYKDMLEEIKPNIKILVNASGFGKFCEFEKGKLEDYYNMIDLNDKALVAMTYISLPYMEEYGQIYQMGSLSSFQPVPYIGIYGASKAFVLSFSRALNVELKKRKIKVMAVCPGWVKTEFFNRAVVDDTITYYNKYFTPEEVVKRAMKDMKKGKDVSICGASVRLQVFFTKLLPHKLVMKIWCKQQKK